MLSADKISLSCVRLDHANEDLLTATNNHRDGLLRAADNRAYYAVFHTIRAILALDGVDFSTHGLVIGYFNQHYVKTNIFERSLGKAVKAVEKSRNDSDYNDLHKPDPTQTKLNIEFAQQFLTSVEAYIAERIALN